MTLVTAIRTRIEARVTELVGRTEEVADLAELVRQNALPQRSPFAFVLPLGFDGAEPDVAAGIYRQGLTETVGVILYVEAAGDPKAKRALATVDALVAAVRAAIAGYEPPGEVDVCRALRGRLLSVTAGAVLYQLDFALPDQLRIAS